MEVHILCTAVFSCVEVVQLFCLWPPVKPYNQFARSISLMIGSDLDTSWLWSPWGNLTEIQLQLQPCRLQRQEILPLMFSNFLILFESQSNQFLWEAGLLFVSLIRAKWALRMTVIRRCWTSSQSPVSMFSRWYRLRWPVVSDLTQFQASSHLSPHPRHQCSTSAAPAASWRPEVRPHLPGPGRPGHRLPAGGGRSRRSRHPRPVQSPPGWVSVWVSVRLFE